VQNKNQPVDRNVQVQETHNLLHQPNLPGLEISGNLTAWLKDRVRNWHSSLLLPALLMVISSLIWILALRDVKIDQMNDLGLISVLPIPAFIALGLLTASFSFSVTAPKINSIVIFAHMVLLVFMLYGITAIVEVVPRFSPAWRHAGVIDYIMRNESVNPRIDAYFNWPGFFILGALTTQISGLSSAVFFLKWSPFFFQFLYMGPLWMIYDSLTTSRRLVWFAIWVFYLTNWVGQDYFSPQAMNFFYFLVILAILLRWFKNPDPKVPGWVESKVLGRVKKVQGLVAQFFTREISPAFSLNPLQKSFLLFMIVLMYFVSVTSHQLTQFAVLGSVFLLLLFQRITPKALPMVMLILSGRWIAYMASAFMAGRLRSMLEAFGQLESALDANLVSRMSGSAGHVLVTRIRLMITLGIWLAALIGFIRRWLRGAHETSAALLLIAPFPLIAMQNYGGEMLMRVYMFSLPLSAYLAASVVFPLVKDPPSWRYSSVIFILSLVLAGTFWFGRYGNERMEYFTPAEVQAVEYTYAHAAPGTLIATVTTNLPYKSINYEKYKYVRLEQDLVNNDFVSIMATLKNSKFTHTYVLITRAQQAYIDLYYPPGTIDLVKLENQLLLDPSIKLVYSNSDARLLEINNSGVLP
jgi:hypothetical protein